MVTVQLCMLDIDLKRLDALKLDSKNDAIAKFVKAFDPQGGFDSFEGDAAELRSAIDSLQKQGVVEVLSRPAIMTRSGEEAFLQIGQSIPQPSFAVTGEPCVQHYFVGMSASVMPEVVDQNTVRMLVKVCCSEPGAPNSMHELESIVLAHCGEPVFLSGLRTAANGKTIAKLIVICPQIVKNDDLPPPLPVAANSGYSCGPAPCGEAVQPASVNFEACPTSESSAGACKCGSSATCGGKCGDNCTCGSLAARTTKDATDVHSKSIVVHVELLELNRTKSAKFRFRFCKYRRWQIRLIRNRRSSGRTDCTLRIGPKELVIWFPGSVKKRRRRSSLVRSHNLHRQRAAGPLPLRRRDSNSFQTSGLLSVHRI